ncbi:monocarboxylate transporter 13-like isoform X1 [Mizuhopecten yessoensis]|uniref:Monocarboxylate transporter 12 n=1 Tax=Mizuhopecten yessoensis TaxID=6573 RepID=A0A210QEL7_MIZYE|nr:monocarboxylate transporter 13-like isoform X1 [Mizuhopecten yessoensis]XP_021360060.1 monocarboxylate transporter 13-like isoform X1 [Mizuhopecten yessoensis]OWF47175.1 Monocarboxylate transporter 12 [Mizuhopecten yessoensis]
MEKPDGAWAWVVVIAASCIRIIVYGNSYTSGVVYYVILDVFGKSRAETSWIASVITAATFATCPISGVLVNRFGMRKVALVGGIVASSGLMASSFATNLPILTLCYGVITGIGCGLTFIPGSVAVARYFTKRRNIAMGVAGAGSGIGSFAFPPIINYLTEKYSWRGMFMILSGISLNMCMLALLYRPVTSPNNNSVEVSDQEQPITEKKETERKKNVWTFLKLSDFYVLALNNILYQLGSTIVYGHLGTYAIHQLKFDKVYASMLYSIIGLTVMLFKLGQGFVIQNPRWKFFQSYQQYILWYTVGGVSTIVFPFIDMGYAGLVVFSLLFGASNAATGGSIIPAILIDLSGVDQFTLTYAIILFTQSIGMLLGPFVAGLLFDTLKSYDAAFVLAGVLMIISAGIMIFPCRNYKAPETMTDTIYVVTSDQHSDDVEAASNDGHEEDKYIGQTNDPIKSSLIKRTGEYVSVTEAEEASRLIESTL